MSRTGAWSPNRAKLRNFALKNGCAKERIIFCVPDLVDVAVFVAREMGEQNPEINNNEEEFAQDVREDKKETLVRS